VRQFGSSASGHGVAASGKAESCERASVRRMRECVGHMVENTWVYGLGESRIGAGGRARPALFLARNSDV
jgi:hypothetical protein